MPFGKVAGIRDETGNASACLESSPPDHPARLKVRICDEAGLLADGVRALARYSLRLPAGSGWSWQWRGSEQHRSQLRGQPRLGPRSLLSFDVGEEPRKRKATQGVGMGQWLVDFEIGGISVASGAAAGGFALTASPFFKRQKGTKRLLPRRRALRL